MCRSWPPRTGGPILNATTEGCRPPARLAASRATALAFVALVVCVSCADGTRARPLTDGEAASRAPAWSPDGRRIAFESDRDGDWDLYVVEVESGEVGRLTDSAANDRYPTWSPDGRHIAFVRELDGDFGLDVLDTERGEIARILAMPGEALAFPAWSPDGAEIAFNRRRGEAYEVWSTRVRARAEVSPVRILDAARWPRWSPDGKRLAFFSRRETGGVDDEIHLFDRGTGGTIRLTHRAGHDFCPAWSPTGDRLVVAGIDPDGARSLRVLTLAGVEEIRLAQGYHRASEPAWSPDGAWIAFAGVAEEGHPYRLFLLPVPRGIPR